LGQRNAPEMQVTLKSTSGKPSRNGTDRDPEWLDCNKLASHHALQTRHFDSTLHYW